MLKATTGQYDMINQLTGFPTKGSFYRWEQQKFCPRCGKPNPYYN